MRQRAHSWSLVLLIVLARLAVAQDDPGSQTTNSIDGLASDSSYWQLQATGFPTASIRSLSVVDAEVCWLAGASGMIIRTTNDGASWSLVPPGIIDTQMVTVIEGVSGDIAYASTTPSDTTYIFRTMDGGLSWNVVYSQYGGRIDAIKMFDASMGIALGEPIDGRWTVLKTSNGGASWYRVSSEPLQFTDGKNASSFGTLEIYRVWFLDSNDQLFESSSGDTWTDIHVALSAGPWLLWKNGGAFLLVGASEVWRFDRSGGWLYSGEVPARAIPRTGLVGPPHTSEFWLAQGLLYYTPDAGRTWSAGPPNGLNKATSLLDMTPVGSDLVAWALGLGDTVYRYHRIATGVDVHPLPRPREFSLGQNYPNPFNPATKIAFYIGRASSVTIKVYDILGRELTTLVDEFKEPGEYTVQWNADGFPSGMYYYQLQTGFFMETKRLVLLR